MGPVVGGVILDSLGEQTGWRWIFFVNLPIAMAAVVLAIRWLPDPPARDRARRIDADPVGVVLLGAGVLGILLPVVETGRGGAGVPWWVALVGLAFLGAFFGWERSYTRRGRSPLVDLALFRVPGYASGAAVGTIYFAGFTGIFFVLTIFFQQELGYTPLLAGLAVTPFAAGSAVTSAIGGRLVSRFERSLVTAGLTIVLVGVIGVDLVLGTVHDSSLGWWLAGPLLVAGIGSGLVISPNITLTVARVPVERAGTAGGLLQTGSASARLPESRSSAPSSTPASPPARARRVHGPARGGRSRRRRPARQRARPARATPSRWPRGRRNRRRRPPHPRGLNVGARRSGRVGGRRRVGVVHRGAHRLVGPGGGDGRDEDQADGRADRDREIGARCWPSQPAARKDRPAAATDRTPPG